MAQQPVAKPFKYLYIPCEASVPVEEKHFNGSGEDDLKRAIVGHFHSRSMSVGQRTEMASHLYQKAKSSAKGNVGAAAEETDDASPLPPKDDDQIAGLLATAIDQSSYEIVPVVMPMRANSFIGTSLYIDDAGRFKDLPINSRASKLAQKDVRGDAFLLSNHDDPALDEWERVDCTEETFQRILKNPVATLDTSDQLAMARATALRENDAKVITEENAKIGLQSKADGNAFFAKGEIDAAIKAYTACIDATEGRADLCSNGADITAARTASFLNRSLCYGKLNDWNSAEKDAAKVVFAIDSNNLKGWFRLATARSHLKDFAGAEEALAHLEAIDTSKTAAADISQLRADMANAKARLEAAERKKYSKMFA